MALVDFINFVMWLLPTLTFFTHVGLVATLAHVLFYRKGFFYELYRENKDKLLWMAFTVALVSTLGSLFYSDVLSWDPCKLCWYQRIFMYPFVIILGIAAWKRDWNVAVYALPVLAVGAAIAVYHYGLQLMAKFYGVKISCGVEGIQCDYVYSFFHGYVTVPMMALTAFVAIGLLVYLARVSNGKRKREHKHGKKRV